MTSSEAPALLHIVGYLTGAALYGMLLVTGLRAPWPIIGTALLGLAWNVGELATHGLDDAGFSAAVPWTAALSYGALGLLAAVAVHAAWQGPAPAPRQAGLRTARITQGAYACATAAAVLQLFAAGTGRPLPWPPGLFVLTGGLGVLAVALLVSTRHQAHGRRAVWIATLALLAVSALHLGQRHGADESWVTELVGHQASIPLALALLYQDYRVGFVDLFLKRALALLAVVALAFAGWSLSARVAGAPSTATPAAGLLLVLWVGTALLFPWLRRQISAFVDRVLLGRADYATTAERAAAALRRCESEDDVLRSASATIADTFDPAGITWRTLEPGAAAGAEDVTVLTAGGPHHVITIGPLREGRRLLSDDRRLLSTIAQLAGRRIDAIRLAEERYARQLREGEVRVLSTESELRALRAQVNPHFLFNALTTIGYLIQHAPARALSTLLRLTTLLRAVLRSEGEFTTLGQECHLIECYLEIERERFEERLEAVTDVPDALARTTIPALIVQPLVENAIKHGIAGARDGGRVEVSARLTPDGHRVQIVVSNTGTPLAAVGSPDGIGLQNVERRLRCYYGDDAAFVLRTGAAGDTRAEITLPLHPPQARVPAMERAS
ncbi:MAG: histidine kinase [Vicinamibacterales bacterium]